MESLEISIPKPCEASWSKMTQESNGRFCGTCQKVVIDFSAMSNEEIKTYFKSIGKTSVCGRFSTIQLSQQNKLGVTMVGKLPLSKMLAALTLILSGLVFSCERHTKGEVLVTNTLRPTLDSTVHEEKQQPDSSREIIKPDFHKIGEIKAVH